MIARAAAVAMLLLTTAAHGQPRAPDPADAPLRLRFRAQSRARYTSRSLQRATVGGREARTETRVSFAVETGVVSAEGEAARSLRVTDASMSAEALPRAVHARVLRALRGAAMQYRESARGEIRARALTGADDPALRDVLEAMLRGFDAYLPVLPEGAVRVGERWSATREVASAPLPGVRAAVRCETEYTLRELRSDGAAVLDLRVTLATPPGALLAGVPMRGEGRAVGEAVLDLRGGVLREARVRGDFTARLMVRGRELALPSRFEDELRLEGPAAR